MMEWIVISEKEGEKKKEKKKQNPTNCKIYRQQRGKKGKKKKMKNSTKKETPSDITTLSYGFD